MEFVKTSKSYQLKTLIYLIKLNYIKSKLNLNPNNYNKGLHYINLNNNNNLIRH